MQKIYLEKAIDLHHELKELIALSVDESINYKIENEGIRAVGNLIIKGEYKNEDKQTFEETLELDILATFDKILDQRDFSIKVEDFDYEIKDGNIKVSIEAGVHGVVSGEDRYIKDDPLEQIESLIRENGVEDNSGIGILPDMDPVTNEGITPIPQMIAPANQTSDKEDSETLVVNEPTTVKLEKKIVPTKEVEVMEKMPSPAIVVKEPQKAPVTKKTQNPKKENTVKEIDEQLQEVVYPSKARPIFQDTTESVGTYYLYIVKENDTYTSIGEHYGIDEFALKDYNQNRELEIGCVLIVPYVP